MRCKCGGHRSNFECELSSGALKGVKYETIKFMYTEESVHTYTTDFILYKEKNKIIFIEAKGRFWTRGEMNKYLAVQKQIEKNNTKNKQKVELVFLIMSEGVPVPGARPRKDGTKLCMREWIEKNGWRCFTKSTIKEIL